MQAVINIETSADQVAEAVCQVFAITGEQLVTAPKSTNANLARGLFCAVCVMAGIHPKSAATVIKRSRANVITVAKHYRGYIETGDKITRGLYDKILSHLSAEHQHASAAY